MFKYLTKVEIFIYDNFLHVLINSGIMHFFASLACMEKLDKSFKVLDGCNVLYSCSNRRYNIFGSRFGILSNLDYRQRINYIYNNSEHTRF